MPASTKDDQRRERLRELDAVLGRAVGAIGVLALIVQGRENRSRVDDGPLEVTFAAAVGEDAGALPAGLWVTLRRGDVAAAADLLARASGSTFVIGEREEMGDGYRLQTVEETRALPDVDLLSQRLARMLDIPRDVIGVLTEWGAEDPRTRSEVEALLDSRFGTAPADGTGQDIGGVRMSVEDLRDVLQLTPAQTTVLSTLARASVLTIA